ncbi:MAG: hypothetical protein M0Z42_12330, partial [Actinomycetota bacterium]|nr:hypothetical protein [Actinomycetota bacterium]
GQTLPYGPKHLQCGLLRPGAAVQKDAMQGGDGSGVLLLKPALCPHQQGKPMQVSLERGAERQQNVRRRPQNRDRRAKILVGQRTPIAILVMNDRFSRSVHGVLQELPGTSRRDHRKVRLNVPGEQAGPS